MEIIVLMCWSIWISRNDIIFKGIISTVQSCLGLFRVVFTEAIYRAKDTQKILMSQWLDQHL
uniref:Uncharacterized protein n=1 Tax=Setaria viridis TaxID=4556 RepID=A0A4V6D5V3_SETVI|nr:hypothetical protein SEVIR_6G257050v2 [Setaria viridis]